MEGENHMRLISVSLGVVVMIAAARSTRRAGVAWRHFKRVELVMT